MRIAIITNTFPSVSETFITNKVKELARRGHSVFVFASERNTSQFAIHFKGEKKVQVILFSLANMAAHFATHPLALGKWIGKGKKMIFNFYRASLINAVLPDIVHFEFSGIALDYLPVLAILKGKKIVSCRGSGEKVKLLVSDERKLKFRQLFKLVNGIHCVSEDMRNTILFYCEEQGKIMINYPSINTEMFKKNQPDKILEPPLIVSVGRFDFSKGYLIGLLAIKKLAATGLHFKWLIIGGGAQNDELIFHIHKMSLQQHVQLAGVKNSVEIKKTLEQAAIFFLPSVYEGIANSALEAMSMQLPVVATKSGGMEEAVTHGINGLLADVYDYDMLAFHLEYLLKNPDKGALLGMAARNKVLEQFTLQQQTNKYEDFYNQLIKTPD